jgi:hypothetical protein
MQLGTNEVISFPNIGRTGVNLFASAQQKVESLRPQPSPPPAELCSQDSEAATLAQNPFYNDWTPSPTTPCSFTGVTCDGGTVTEM